MKERLTGAIILVALIVLVVPELLTGPPRSTPAGRASPGAGAGSLPAPDTPSSGAQLPVRSYTFNLTASVPARRVSKHTVGKAEPKPPPARSPAPPSVADRSLLHSSPSRVSARAAARTVPAAKPVSHERAPSRAVQPDRPAGTPTRRKPRAAARWVVQLGSFSRHANAQRLAQRLRRRHLPAVVAPLRVRGRMWWRVWVGPVSERAAAERLRRQLRPTGLRGPVLRE